MEKIKIGVILDTEDIVRGVFRLDQEDGLVKALEDTYVTRVEIVKSQHYSYNDITEVTAKIWDSSDGGEPSQEDFRIQNTEV